MSENACCIFCREYIRESPEYKIILTEFLFYNEQCMDILRNRYDSYVFLWSGEELQHRQIDFPRHPLETLSLGAIIKLFSTNGLSIPNHFVYCTNDEQVSSGTDHGTIIFTDHSDNESVKDQDNQVSRQPNVSIEPSVSLTDGNQKEPRNVQKVDEGSDNDNCYSCDMCDTSFSVKTNMLTHKKTNHSIYQCEMCDECFSKKSALTKHFNSCHLQCPHSLIAI